ncbi:hypothetical protein GCM10011415_32860 [Salipiger pallidus]|uniref:UPF0102 protein GCM10011415_32860 n=1 Tax=Salipiger pallidus TaxID=1775170 RepID=A0A8J3EHQ8_9RHOB|nr:YraN family protein [Salipiger pallidus]GGG80825.1 hypothetical protein GCM10011415_32860 [Salipiger pallidus]
MTAHQLAFDFADPVVVPRPSPAPRAPISDTRRARADRGAMGYHAGLSAEVQVARDYERRGYPLVARRWRGKAGEIDLVFCDGDGFVFVEVKKSRSFDRAIERLSRHQIRRVMKAAEEFVGDQPTGSLTEMRFDVALLNTHGMIRVLENAFL